ncbi:transcriptional regulator [Pseudanabaenaceae cyanobacterium LEGE 13415]|nr:transcriptional regulator [Pseudanabaenaceae cyanobacterium LEGE 13415]
MTLTFNPIRYSELLSQYQPKLIKTEEENEQALAIVEDLMHRQDRTAEEDELLDLWVALIEKFEQEHYQIGTTSTPRSMLLFLMEQQDRQESDLIEIFGSEAGVADVLNDHCEMTRTQMKALGEFFSVNPSVFL